MKFYPAFLFVLLLAVPCSAQSSFKIPDEDDIVKIFDDSTTKIMDNAFAKNDRKAFEKIVKAHDKKYKSAAHDGNRKQLSVEAANLGLVSLKKSDISNTLQYFEQSLGSFRATGNIKGELLVLALTGYSYFEQKSDKLALDYYLPALAKAQSINSSKRIALLSFMAGKSCDNLHDDANAIVHFSDALNNFKKQNDKRSAAAAGLSLGESLIRNDEEDRAIAQLQESLNLFEELKDADGSATALRDIGIANFKNEFENALEFFNHSYRKSSMLNVKKLTLESYIKLASVNAASKNKARSQAYDDLYKNLKDSIDRVENSRTLSGKERLKDQDEKNRIKDLMNNEKKIMSQKLTQKDLEYNKKITEAQLERLKKEQTIVQLNDSLRVTKGDKQEQEIEIQKLTNEKTQQELALSQQQVQLKENELSLNTQRNLRNLAIVVSIFISVFLFLIYFRYREKKLLITSLNKALEDLKSTQTQLVQSEKMASLGQLTAGIAHEIQNPLNFVNNFSELSVDLLKELEETKKESERKDIVDDLKMNLEKINHHGKRADNIVKSMLLHSRSEHGEKQLTDLNRLTEDAIKLAWHGMRSARSDFQCTIEKNFGASLPEILVIPQDINRVLLNLFNNAFYAVSERSKSLAVLSPDSLYRPTVTVTTTFSNSSQPNHVIISVKDNGSGIPEDVKEKIFNPFFTTKPTGQGTGLGLSLSYDIIKAHHGEIKVQSEEGAETEFVIFLPV